MSLSRSAQEPWVPRHVGGHGGYKNYPVECFRNLRTSTLMSPTADRMLGGIGKSTLGPGAEMFNAPGETS